MDSTGNTHGIRFRISPPSRANRAACRMVPSEPIGAAVAMATSPSSKAWRTVPAPIASSMTSTPRASFGVPMVRALRGSVRLRPASLTASVCGSACRIRVSENGKNSAERMASGLRPLAAACSPSASWETSMRADQGDGCGRVARAASNSARVAGLLPSLRCASGSRGRQGQR